MRVLLVQPPLTPGGPVEPPVGLVALAAWLTGAGHLVHILDLEFEQRRLVTADWGNCLARFEQELATIVPEVVGVSSMYSNSLHGARLIARAKTVLPSATTVAGGSHFGALPAEWLQRIPELDFVIVGEGEVALERLLCEITGDRDWSRVPSLGWRNGAEVVINHKAPLIDLALLPNPWPIVAHTVRLEDYVETTSADRPVAYIEAGRGCPFTCSFCATAPFWHRQYRVKTPGQIIAEVRLLYEAGYRRFVLVHDLLTVNKRFMSELCDAFLRSKLPIEWMANSRTDIKLEGLLPKMKASGCWKLFFGIETASARLQTEISKNLDVDQTGPMIANLAAHGLTATCSFVIGLPTETPRELSASLLDDVRRVHAVHHRRYGSPRVYAALRAEGRMASRGRVERLMRRHGIRALAGRRYRPCTTDSRHDLPIASNLLKQKFSAALPNTVWLADITYLPTGEGWLYLAAVLDLATRKIVGWSMREHMRTELTSAALMMATQRQRPGAGLICHSDRGSQYAAEAYRKQLADMRATPSMSRTGCCYDNAPMEGFFHTLKVELVHQRRWTTRDEAQRDLFAYIEGYYNRQRIHSALGYITPEQAERNAS